MVCAHRAFGVSLALLIVLSGSLAWGGQVTLQDVSLDGSYAPATSLLATSMSGGTLEGIVYSQALTDGQGHYAYLYQVLNAGSPGSSPIEKLTLWPFAGSSDSTVMGALTSSAPTGFLAGGTAPQPQAYILPITGGPLVSIDYDLTGDASNPPGQWGQVLCILSVLPPETITGNIIDGSVGTGSVVGPVPEPATLSLLTIAGLAALRRRRS